jgi:hypothetical protein
MSKTKCLGILFSQGTKVSFSLWIENLFVKNYPWNGFCITSPFITNFFIYLYAHVEWNKVMNSWHEFWKWQHANNSVKPYEQTSMVHFHQFENMDMGWMPKRLTRRQVDECPIINNQFQIIHMIHAYFHVPSLCKYHVFFKQNFP